MSFEEFDSRLINGAVLEGENLIYKVENVIEINGGGKRVVIGTYLKDDPNRLIKSKDASSSWWYKNVYLEDLMDFRKSELKGTLLNKKPKTNTVFPESEKKINSQRI